MLLLRDSGNNMKKSEPFIIIILLLVFVVAGVILPNAGSLALADELAFVLLIWTLCVYLIIKTVRSESVKAKTTKGVRAVIIAVCIIASVLFSKNLVLDAVNGTETVYLQNIEVSRSQGTSGIFSQHYYVTGYNEDYDRIKIEITAEKYSILSGADSAVIEYYVHTGRSAN